MKDVNQIISKKVDIWIEEYRKVTTDIIKRVDLEQKNLNMNLVFVIAVTGYIMQIVMKNQSESYFTDETFYVFLIASLISQIFTWRHIDHDTNIINMACYIETKIRPNLIKIFDDPSLLNFEAFLNSKRLDRISFFNFISLCGNDHILSIFFSLVFIVFAWYVSIQKEMLSCINVLYLLVVSFLLTSITVPAAIRTMIKYKEISSQAKINTKNN